MTKVNTDRWTRSELEAQYELLEKLYYEDRQKLEACWIGRTQLLRERDEARRKKDNMNIPIPKWIEAELRAEWQVSVHTAFRPPVTVAILTANYNSQTFTGIGISRCMRTDTWNSDTGAHIARVRAERQVMRDIIKAQGEI